MPIDNNLLFERILEYSVYLLSSREYSEKMIEDKIEKKFVLQKSYYKKGEYHKTKEKSEEEIYQLRQITEQVIQFLREKKYLDDQRTAENFLRYRREYSARGKRMISQDMYKKKLNQEVIDNVLSEFSEEEEQLDCIKIAQKKWSSLLTKGDTIENQQKNKERLFRFLAGKGFPYSMITNACEEAMKSEE